MINPESKMEFNPGHSDALRKLGILKEDENSITQQELLKRVLEKNDGKTTEDTLHWMQQEVANRQVVIKSLDLFIEQPGQDLELLQNSVDTLGHTLHFAQLQLPIFAASAIKILESTRQANLLSPENIIQIDEYIKNIKEAEEETNRMLDEKEEYYIDEYARMRKELLNRGGIDNNLFGI